MGDRMGIDDGNIILFVISFYSSSCHLIHHVEQSHRITFRLLEFYNFHPFDVLSKEKDSFANPWLINLNPPVYYFGRIY